MTKSLCYMWGQYHSTSYHYVVLYHPSPGITVTVIDGFRTRMPSPFPKVLTQPRQKGSDGDGVGWFGHVYFVLHIVTLRLILLCILYMMLFLFLYVFDV